MVSVELGFIFVSTSVKWQYVKTAPEWFKLCLDGSSTLITLCSVVL